MRGLPPRSARHGFCTELFRSLSSRAPSKREMLMNNAASTVQLVFGGQPASGAKAHSTWCGRPCTPERRAPPVPHTAGVKQVRNFGELRSMKRYRASLLVLFVLFAIAGMSAQDWIRTGTGPVSYTHLRAHETVLDLVC